MKRIARQAALICMTSAWSINSIAVDTNHTVNSEIFSSFYDVRSDSPFNPGNSLADFPEREFDFQTRLNVGISSDTVDLRLAPRFGASHKSYSENESETDSEAWMHEWSLSYSLGNSYFSVGRELILWGGSQFTSPSNPFYISNNQSNPFIEPPARDFAQAQWVNASGWDLHFIANFDKGRDAANYPEFKNIYAIKTGYTGYASSSALVISARDDSVDLGFYGQWTVNDASLIYFDAAYTESRQGVYPEISAESPLGWRFSPETKKDYHEDVLLGGSYTFKSGSTLNLEYRYNRAGYDDVEFDLLYQLANSAAMSLNSGDPALISESASLLAIAANPWLRSIGRNYLNVQYFKRNVIKNLSINVLASYNLDDDSSQLTPVVNYYLNDNIKLSGNFVFNFGDEYGEYSRYLNHIFYLGIKYYF